MENEWILGWEKCFYAIHTEVPSFTVTCSLTDKKCLYPYMNWVEILLGICRNVENRKNIKI